MGETGMVYGWTALRLECGGREITLLHTKCVAGMMCLKITWISSQNAMRTVLSVSIAYKATYLSSSELAISFVFHARLSVCFPVAVLELGTIVIGGQVTQPPVPVFRC